jgi:tRNA G10  N-methylase Trm11
MSKLKLNARNRADGLDLLRGIESNSVAAAFLDPQYRALLAVTNRGDLVVDPCAGGYGILEICRSIGRNFLGCDVNDDDGEMKT